MSLSGRHRLSAVMVGDFDDRMRARAILVVGVVVVVVVGHTLLSQAVDTSTRSGWLIANSVWALAVVAAAAMVVDIFRQRTVKQVYLEVTAAGIVLRTGRNPETTTISWAALSGIILKTSYRATLRSRRARLRLILIPGGGAGVVTDPQFDQWRGRYGAHGSDLGIPVLLVSERFPLDEALKQFAGPLYRGVVDGGTTFSF
ncbi:hypothetical protein GCM10011575_46250 [Microlunatus endophyticus]|uniref:PH domain-containing protein n=1 Tax=Microlunatus endophyticus TaxID=1716077 RepID=A0A917SJR0_9ACTN|nr:hypothetical protein [Microlunatus endophyticus]GGL82717.1 hypothetical protein GCM10011575_46250 [Microlunatus endophyticus]